MGPRREALRFFSVQQDKHETVFCRTTAVTRLDTLANQGVVGGRKACCNALGLSGKHGEIP